MEITMSNTKSRLLQSLLSHHRPSGEAWARSQLEAQEEFVRREKSRDEEQKFGIY
jgi:hypothetical protein